jgi:2-(1,2-epoxy-1,2-dihydrophenyl)acetyl-CoA isomerase
VVIDAGRISSEISDGIGLLRINRPERLNALSPEMLVQLRTTIADLPDSGARVIVLTGSGRAFSSGADLVAGDGSCAMPDDLGALLEEYYSPLVEQMWQSPVPILCAVNGAAAGAGCSLALCADFILAAESAYFLQSFVNIGLIPDAGSTWILPRLVGNARAMEMMLLGERISAAKALEWGLINRVVGDSALLEQTLAVARKIAAGPADAYSLLRRVRFQAMECTLAQTLSLEAQAQRVAGRTPAFEKAIERFISKSRKA